MRSVYVCSCNGCELPLLAKAADAEFAEQGREAQLAKGRRKPVVTVVGRYVARRAPAVARRLEKVLTRHAKRVAGLAARLYAQRLAKDAAQDALILQRIIDELNLEAVGIDLNGELATAMLEAFRRAAALGRTQAGMTIDDITAQVDNAAVDWALEHGGELIKDLAGTTAKAMKFTIARAVEEGMSPKMLADEIMKMGAFGAARAMMIAQTELARAHVQGNVQGWRDSGEVVGKRWLLADTHKVADECDEAADAGVVPLEDEFVPGIRFPPDPHPGCWCDVLPVLREE